MAIRRGGIGSHPALVGSSPSDQLPRLGSRLAGEEDRDQMNRGQIERCLQGSVRNIGYDFDDACSDADRAGMQALNNIFKNYIWSCVR